MLTWANLKRYWKEHLVHVALAGVGGFFVYQWHPGLWGMAILMLIMVRQVMEWANSAPLEGRQGTYQARHAGRGPWLSPDRQHHRRSGGDVGRDTIPVGG